MPEDIKEGAFIPKGSLTAAPVLMGGATTRELSYGEKAVGLTFNPSQSPQAQEIKHLYAMIIDTIKNLPDPTDGGVSEKSLLIEEAIRQAQTSLMWAVKVITYK